MAFLSSTWMMCDGCGRVANHPVILLPDGWEYADGGPDVRDNDGNPIPGAVIVLCPVCQKTKKGITA